MSATVDVLAVMRRQPCLCLSVAQHGEGGYPGCYRCSAIAAVAELIEAAQAVAVHQDAAISAEWDRLDAALARVQGGAK